MAQRRQTLDCSHPRRHHSRGQQVLRPRPLHPCAFQNGLPLRRTCRQTRLGTPRTRQQRRLLAFRQDDCRQPARPHPSASHRLQKRCQHPAHQLPLQPLQHPEPLQRHLRTGNHLQLRQPRQPRPQPRHQLHGTARSRQPQIPATPTAAQPLRSLIFAP